MNIPSELPVTGLTFWYKLRMALPALLLIGQSESLSAQTTIVPFSNTVNGVTDNSYRFFTVPQMENFEDLSFAYKGLSKVTGATSTDYTYSTTAFWPQGAWGRGYADGLSASEFMTFNDGYPSAHPLIRDCHDFFTAHLYDYLSGINTAENLTQIKHGVDYLLANITASGEYIYWEKRSLLNNMDLHSNTPDDYETSYGLHALCEYQLSGIDYRRSEVWDAIVDGEIYLRDNADWIVNTNNNVRGLGLWALANIYRVTRNCETLERIMSIANTVYLEQDSDGQWRTGGQESHEYGGIWYAMFHDQKIFYHFMILRGLAEAFSVMPQGMAATLTVEALKKGLNHLIQQRTYPGRNGFLYLWDLREFPPSRNIVYVTSSGYYNYIHDDPSKTMDALIRVYYLSKGSYYFTETERTSLKNLVNMTAKWIDPSNKTCYHSAAIYRHHMEETSLAKRVLNWGGDTPNYDAKRLTDGVVTGDFDNDGKKDDVAGFYGYGSSTAIHVWKQASTQIEYTGDKVWWHGTQTYADRYKGKVVAGDFDNDGFEDDIAAMYDYGNSVIKIWVFVSNGSSFSAYDYYSNSAFNPANAEYRFVSGDFDNDNFKDDIACFYSYGGNSTTAWVFKSMLNTNGTRYFSAVSFWSTPNSFDATKIKGNVVSGDFDNDGKFDDIMTFYDYGNGTTKAWGFRSNGSSFAASEFWNGPSCSAMQASKRYISGDFDNDGKHDDVAAFFDAGGTNTNLYIFKSNGSSMVANLHMASTSYTASKITGRVVAGDFAGTGYNQIRALYEQINTVEWHNFAPGTLLGNPVAIWSKIWDQNTSIYCPVINAMMIDPNNSGNQDGESISEILSVTGLKVYPNPSNDVISIDTDLDIRSLRIIDLNGKEMMATSDPVKIPVAELVAGTYIVLARQTHLNLTCHSSMLGSAMGLGKNGPSLK